MAKGQLYSGESQTSRQASGFNLPSERKFEMYIYFVVVFQWLRRNFYADLLKHLTIFFKWSEAKECYEVG